MYEKINEFLIIEEPEIKIVKKINEDLIIKQDLEAKRVETIEEEIKKKFSRISMKSNHMIVNLKILLFWWKAIQQSLLILLGLIDLIQLLVLIW